VDAEAAGLGVAKRKSDERDRSEIGKSEWSRAAGPRSCSRWRNVKSSRQGATGQVGFSLSRTVLMAKVDTREKVGANSVETVARKLEDTFRASGGCVRQLLLLVNLDTRSCARS
jgi:hypothetical protein